MPAIRPVLALRSYTEVLGGVRPGSPVFLAKNGHGEVAQPFLEGVSSREAGVCEQALLRAPS